MTLFKYFSDERFAHAFMKKGEMRFGSLNGFRRMEDGAVRGDPKDGTLQYAPPDGLQITMLADGRKISGISFASAAQNMFIYCMSKEKSADLAKGFGPFCVEISEPSAILSRLRSRASRASKLDYAKTIFGNVEYRQLDKIPGIDWDFPERIVLIKPPEYAAQQESRIALPLAPAMQSNDDYILIRIGNLESMTRLHRLK